MVRFQREGDWDGHQEWSQSGIPLAFWEADVHGLGRTELAMIRLFSWDEAKIPNTELLTISVDGPGAEVVLEKISALNNASYVVCDKCSLESHYPGDKVLIAFETEW